MPELLFLALRTFVAAIRSRRHLTLENLVLRHQLQVASRTNPHPRLRAPDRVGRVVFASVAIWFIVGTVLVSRIRGVR